MQRISMGLTKSTLKRLSKFLIHSVLILAFLWKAYEAWLKFDKRDTMMVTKVKHLKNQTFPSVTLCRGIIIELVKDANVTEIVEYNSRIENWLNSSFEGVVGLEYWEKREMSQLLTLDYVHSICHTFNPPKMIPPGIHHGLDLLMQSNAFSYFYIILHDAAHNIPIFGDIFGANSVALPVTTVSEPYQLVHMAISTENTVSLSTKEEPCHDPGNKHTMMDCIEGYFQASEGCVLKWQQHKINTTTRNGKTCDQKSLNHYKSFMKELINTASFGEVYRLTGCIFSCEKKTYLYKKSMEVSLPVNSDTISLGMYLAPSGVTMKQEVLVFDTLEMIGNVGGYLGLLLGWSAMSLVQLYFDN